VIANKPGNKLREVAGLIDVPGHGQTVSNNDFDFEAKPLCYKIRYLTRLN